jgi:hypothetical protein
VSRDFLDNPQGNAVVAHLGQSGAAEGMGGGSFDANSIKGFS